MDPCRLRDAPSGANVPAALTVDAALARMPENAHRPRFALFSREPTITTASAPAGSRAPVRIRTPPAPTTLVPGACPVWISPTIRSDRPGAGRSSGEREPVHRGDVPGRKIPFGENVLGEDAAVRLPEHDLLPAPGLRLRQEQPLRFRDLDHEPAFRARRMRGIPRRSFATTISPKPAPITAARAPVSLR